MNQYLRDYQQEGVQFLYSRYSSNAGSVLCDDMGLGKTVQVRCMLVSYPDLPFLSGGFGCDQMCVRPGVGDSVIVNTRLHISSGDSIHVCSTWQDRHQG